VLPTCFFYAFKFYKYTRKSKIYEKEPKKGEEESIDLTVGGKKIEGDWLSISQVENMFAEDKEELEFIRKVKRSMSFQYAIDKFQKKSQSKLQIEIQRKKESSD